jgi:DNA mismatch repair ATPase MutS
MQSFILDQQTLNDLNIFPKQKGDLSILNLLDNTQTKGGKEKLWDILSRPTNDLSIINSRIEAIKFIQDKKLFCKLDYEYLDFIEYYINQNTSILSDNILDACLTKISDKLKPTNEYFAISRGLEFLRKLLIEIKLFLDNIRQKEVPIFISLFRSEINLLIQNERFEKFLYPNKNQLNFVQINQFDALIREEKKLYIKRIIKLIYQLDAYQSVAEIANQQNWGYPTLKEGSEFKISGLFHPFIENVVSNTIGFEKEQNLCFVTGANMAGKSTFLKATSLCVYLAHCGLPVPAKAMNSSVFSGLMSSINMSDDINKGYSHFYSEVKRVKDVILKIKEHQRVFVIFDELFRGTYVKDAYEASLMITNAFSKIKQSTFFISTHITEVGEALQSNASVLFKCFKPHLEKEDFKYDYTLYDDISRERLGLKILEDEQIDKMIGEIIHSNYKI